MRTPAFWYADDGTAARLLSPLGSLYGLGVRLRFAWAKPWRAPVPVVCIGNIVAGGAGKTPVALALAEALRHRNLHPWFLSRGHGGTDHGPRRVDPERDPPGLVGDEPLLLARAAPCVIARDRTAGARMAVEAGAGAILMDDGFQNPALVKDLSVVVVDGMSGFGNKRLVPAGPLRESVARGLARADALAIIGPDATGAARHAVGLPVLHGRLEPGPEAAELRGRRICAFAGIGRPEKFFATLRAIGAEPAVTIAFADHHPYTDDDARRLIETARDSDSALVTTEKDAVRLPPEIRERTRVLTVRCVWDDPSLLDRLLDGLSEKREA